MRQYRDINQLNNVHTHTKNNYVYAHRTQFTKTHYYNVRGTPIVDIQNEHFLNLVTSPYGTFFKKHFTYYIQIALNKS